MNEEPFLNKSTVVASPTAVGSEDTFTPCLTRNKGGAALDQSPIEDLKGNSVRGGVVALVAQGLKFALRTGAMMVLARLLTPEDFGLQGMVLAMTGFFNLFKDAGLSAVTVQRKHVSGDQLSALFWTNAVVGLLLALALVALSPAIALFFRDERLTWIAVVSATSFLFNGLCVQHLALLQRQMKFVAMATIEVMSLVISSAIGVMMAWLGYRYWSLVGMTVALPLVSAVGAWIAIPWVPGAPKRGIGLRSMLSFGGTLTCNSLVVYLAYNTEKILLGHFWGTTALGLYGRAYQLVSLPSDQLTGAVSVVAFPSLSRLQHDPERLERAFLKGYSLILSLTIPTTVCCAIFADEIVHVMLGPQWKEVVPIFRLLSPTILAFALVNPLAWFLIASGRIRRSLNMAFLIAPCVIVGVLLGVKFGPTGVALAFSSMMTLLIVPLIAWACAGTTMSGRVVWAAVARPLAAGLLAAMAGLGIRIVILGSVPSLFLLVLGAGIVFSVHFLVLMFGLGQKHVYLDLFKQLTRSKS
jgi:O-antigen/teichoic acid export membrane protein